jgi:CheY-like chemotaxis protein
MLELSRAAMLVDDNEDDRFLVERAWAEAGIRHKLVSVDSGRAALDYLFGAGVHADRLRHPLPAFLLLDIKMPGVSGFDVLSRIRADEKLRGLPVLMLTASSAPSDIAEAHRLGANGFFIKPSSVAELVDLLKAVDGCWLRFNQFPELA